ncbi:PAS domain S-box protein [Haladaptatus halobius]|uniref:PAS domain S-box protein n=1 Tax=Haladaptatus halobius TaxID=2884875 RepID=UPI001D0AB33C
MGRCSPSSAYSSSTPASPSTILLWTLALATGIGAVGGLAIGTNEARAITQAYEAERRNRELTRYETLIEEATDVNAILDPDGTLRYLTPSVEHVLGYAPDELVGRNANRNSSARTTDWSALRACWPTNFGTRSPSRRGTSRSPRRVTKPPRTRS